MGHRRLEAIPLFLLTALLLVMLDVPTTAARVLFGLFAASRVLYSLAYIRRWQPLRTISFAIGTLDQVAVLGFIGYYVFVA